MQFILQTKLFQPQVTGKQVIREATNAQLKATKNKKLILLVAPAGYGKSTLMAQWGNQIKNSVWYSIDKSDNTTSTFLSYLLTGIQKYNNKIAEIPIQILDAQLQNPPGEYILGQLINGLTGLNEELFIFLDDYHLITDNQIHNLISFFFENIPENIHLVIGTRSDPPFLMARLRSLGQLLEFRIKDLCFTEKEAASFFEEKMELRLDNTQIKKINNRIEGWAAGLQMAGISLQGTNSITEFIDNFSANNQFILDYLMEEIYHRQTEEIKNFLLNTCILNRFNIELCDYINEITISDKVLKHLKKSNLFIVPLDNERNWYRYHHLFSDLLFQRKQKYNPENLAGLHLRAGEWFEKNGDTADAVDHFIKANNFERAEKLISQSAQTMWLRGEHRSVLNWLKLFPENFIYSPNLYIMLAVINILDGNYDKAELNIQTVQTSIKATNETADQSEINGIIAAVKAYIYNYRGDIEATEKQGKKALKLLNGNSVWSCLAGLALGDAYVQKGPLKPATKCYEDSFKSGNLSGSNYCNTLVQHRLVVAYYRRGKLNYALRLIEQFSDEKNLIAAPSGTIFLIHGELFYEFNRLDEAEQKLIKTIELCRQQLHIAALPYSQMILSKIYFGRNNIEKTISLINESLCALKQSDMPPWVESFVWAWKAQFEIMSGNMDSAKNIFEERDIHLNGEFKYANLTDYVVLGQYLTQKKDTGNAIQLLKRLSKKLIEIEWMELALKAQLLLAYNHKANGDPGQAIAIMEQVLAFAEKENYKRTFIDLWKFCGDILNTLKKDGKFQKYIHSLQLHMNQGNSTTSLSNTIPEPLSSRELEILKLLQTQLSNSEIADSLYISVNTVKTHIKNIYFKLDVANRKEAVVKAFELKLV